MLSSKVKEYRKERQMSQYDFAKFLGISRSYIGDIERGRVKGTLNLIKILTDKTGLDYSYWVDDNDIEDAYVNDIAAKPEEFIATTTILQLILSNDGYDKITKEIHPNNWDSLIKVFKEEVKMKILIYEDKNNRG